MAERKAKKPKGACLVLQSNCVEFQMFGPLSVDNDFVKVRFCNDKMEEPSKFDGDISFDNDLKAALQWTASWSHEQVSRQVSALASRANNSVPFSFR